MWARKGTSARTAATGGEASRSYGIQTASASLPSAATASPSGRLRPSIPLHEAATLTGPGASSAATASSTVAARATSTASGRTSAWAAAAAVTASAVPMASISRGWRVLNSRKLNRSRTAVASNGPMRRSLTSASRGTSRTRGVAVALRRTTGSWAMRLSRSLGVHLSTLANTPSRSP